MKKIFLSKMSLVLVLPALLVMTLGGCKGGKNDKDTLADDKANAEAKKDTAVKTIFYSVPSPIETATLIQKIGLPYDKDYLNSIKKVSTYNTISSKALNLGVYGADLSFTSIYEQNQESMLFLKCANTLAKEIGISGAFDENTANRLEANKNNKDSLLGIISESFWTADAFLKENERPGTSSLIIAGGWIESLYIACRIQKASNNGDITTRIAEQKFTLNNLCKMLKRHSAEDPAVAEIQKDLEDLKVDYDKIGENREANTTTKDEKTGVTTIGGNNSLAMNDDLLKSIISKVNALRTKIIK